MEMGGWNADYKATLHQKRSNSLSPAPQPVGDLHPSSLHSLNVKLYISARHQDSPEEESQATVSGHEFPHKDYSVITPILTENIQTLLLLLQIKS